MSQTEMTEEKTAEDGCLYPSGQRGEDEDVPATERLSTRTCPFPPDDGNSHLYVMIDTNAFMIPVRFRVDIFGELRRLGFSRFVVPEAVIRELDGLSKKKSGTDKAAARTARRMAEKCCVIPGKGYADDIIEEQASLYGIAVLTNDAALKKRLSEKNVKVISLRQKTHLEPVMR